MEYGKQLVKATCAGESREDFLQRGVHVVLNQVGELLDTHSGDLGELCGFGYDLLDELLECGGGHLHFLHVLVKCGGEAEDLIGSESGLYGDAAQTPCEVDHVLLVGGAGLAQFVDGGAQRQKLLFEVLVFEHIGGLFVNVHHLADGKCGIVTENVSH